MSLSNPVFTSLPNLACNFHCALPRPTIHPFHTNCIIVTTINNETYVTPGIYEYNLISNNSKRIHTHDEASTICTAHGQCIDAVRKTLYCWGHGEHLLQFDLETNIGTYYSFSKEARCVWPSIAYIPPPVDQIHAMDIDQHHKYQIETKAVTFNSLQQDFPHEYPNLLYVPSRKQLIMFGANRYDGIWCCDIEQNTDQSEYNWTLAKIEMPQRENIFEYDIVLGFKNVLFVFYFDRKEIYLLDLMNDKWHKSKQSLICIDGGYNTFAMENNGCVHIVNFIDGVHVSASLHDLIPEELIKLRRKYYHPLVIGYLRETETELTLGMPCVLKQLTLYYFPLFSSAN